VGESVTLYIVRHAEKAELPEDAPEDERRDPPLSQAGELRALSLTEDVPVEDISAIYVTKTRRAQDTASAVAAVSGKEPLFYDPKNVPNTIRQLRHYHGDSLLIVGHSNTIPPLLKGLGVEQEVRIAEDQYGDMWVVHASPDGTATLETRHYGGSVDRFDPGR
jgi:broad specificity phosphatase PhoE